MENFYTKVKANDLYKLVQENNTNRFLYDAEKTRTTELEKENCDLRQSNADLIEKIKELESRFLVPSMEKFLVIPADFFELKNSYSEAIAEANKKFEENKGEKGFLVFSLIAIAEKGVAF